MDNPSYDSVPFRANVFDTEITPMRAPKILFHQPQSTGNITVPPLASNNAHVIGANPQIPLNATHSYSGNPGYSQEIEASALPKPLHPPYEAIKTPTLDQIGHDFWPKENLNSTRNYDYSIIPAPQQPSVTFPVVVVPSPRQSLEARLHSQQFPTRSNYSENLVLPTANYQTSKVATEMAIPSSIKYHPQQNETIPCTSNNYLIKGGQEQSSSSYEKNYYNQSIIEKKELLKNSNVINDDLILNYLQMAIEYLNENPGQFDLMATELNSMLASKANNNYVLSVAMEDIFQEALKNKNFRYMGAKLYILLQKLDPSSNSVFSQLLERKLDHHRNEEILNLTDTDKNEKICATVLFLAEFYMQMNAEKFQVQLIASELIIFLRMLLSKETPENIRCVCLCLKLVGFDLSRDNSVIGGVNDILEELRKLNVSTPGKYPMINSVITLEKNNWGRENTNLEDTDEPTSNSNATISQYGRDIDEPVFYGPDGYQISAEECEFLTQRVEETEYQDPSNYVIIDCVDPELDPDTKEHYLSFLQEQNRAYDAGK